MPVSSKNDLAVEMTEAFPSMRNEQVCVFMDSWYISEKIVNSSNRKGFHVITAAKTNRLICVSGVRISIADFAAQYIRKPDLRSVTVKSRERTGFMNMEAQ